MLKCINYFELKWKTNKEINKLAAKIHHKHWCEKLI